MHTLDTKTTVDFLKSCMKVDRPVMMWGSPGVGKSDIVQRIAESEGRPVVDVRLLLMEPTDLKGIPYFDPTQGKMVWAEPAELPETGGPLENAILFLDEITAAPPSVQAAAYQLVLNRRIGTYELPQGVYVVAAGNKESDKAISHRMPTALANRFIHVEIEPTWQAWSEWAINNGIAPEVMGYLGDNRHMLHKMPENGEKAFPSPRSWAFVSSILEANKGASNSLIEALVAGTVGDGVAMEFMAFREIVGKNPKAEDIINAVVTEHDFPEISSQYACAVSTSYAIVQAMKHGENKEKLLEYIDNFLVFFDKNTNTEITFLGLHFLIHNDDLLNAIDREIANLKVFNDMFDTYARYLSID